MPEVTNNAPVLAIYDFRSKQEYIYRTNKMREITGASLLIAGMYDVFLNKDESKVNIHCDWNQKHPRTLIARNGSIVDDAFKDNDNGAVDGVVVYNGGGNLCVLFRNRMTYERANRSFSRIVLDRGYTLSMISAAVEWERKNNARVSFDHNLRRVHRALDVNKRIGGRGVFCNVLPYTMVDRTTFQPITAESVRSGEEHSRESELKLSTFKSCADVEQGKFIDDIGTEIGDDSLVAVVYFDGNSIGEELMRQGGSIEGMRKFSQNVHSCLVTNTEKAMIDAILGVADERQRGYRIIIDHGDEITLICNAHVAPLAIKAYFGALTRYHACAGMAICHSHDPFSEVYRIAEELCESGKKRNRKLQQEAMELELANGNGKRAKERAIEAARRVNADYIDFHFCRSGITGSLEQIRGAQEAKFTRRPYRVSDEFQQFLAVGSILRNSSIARSDIKELNRAILRGDSWYALEYERIKAKDYEAICQIEQQALGDDATGWPEDHRAALKRLLFDVTSLYDVFDLCFAE